MTTTKYVHPPGPGPPVPWIIFVQLLLWVDAQLWLVPIISGGWSKWKIHKVWWRSALIRYSKNISVKLVWSGVQRKTMVKQPDTLKHKIFIWKQVYYKLSLNVLINIPIVFSKQSIIYRSFPHPRTHPPHSKWLPKWSQTTAHKKNPQPQGLNQKDNKQRPLKYTGPTPIIMEQESPWR